MNLGILSVFFSGFLFFASYAVNPASDLGISYEEEDVLYEYVHHWNKEERADFAFAGMLGSAGMLWLGIGIGRISRGV